MDNHMLNGSMNEIKTEDPVYFSKVRLADKKIEIETRNKQVLAFCKEYIDKYDCPDFVVRATNEEIESEFEAKHPNYQQLLDESIEATFDYTIAETNVIYRKIAEAMLEYDTLLIHGAVISVHNKGIMFTAQSGTGKTTHMMKWLQNLDEAFVVNGDKPLIKIQDNEVKAYGTPWCGKEKLANNTMVPLKFIVLMERSKENHIEEMPFGKAYPFLLQQTYIPHDPDKVKKTFALLAKLHNQVRIYRFQFNNFADDCFETAYKTLMGNRNDEG